MGKNYYIVGDFKVCSQIKSCLIILTTVNTKEKDLENVKNNPPKDCLGNIKIECENAKNCWWNEGNLD